MQTTKHNYTEQQEINEAVRQYEYNDMMDAGWYPDMDVRDAYAFYIEQQIHDFVNSPEGIAQEDQFFQDKENGFRHVPESTLHIYRKVKSLQKEINDLASLLEELT